MDEFPEKIQKAFNTQNLQWFWEQKFPLPHTHTDTESSEFCTVYHDLVLEHFIIWRYAFYPIRCGGLET